MSKIAQKPDVVDIINLSAGDNSIPKFDAFVRSTMGDLELFWNERYIELKSGALTFSDKENRQWRTSLLVSSILRDGCGSLTVTDVRTASNKEFAGLIDFLRMQIESVAREIQLSEHSIPRRNSTKSTSFGKSAPLTRKHWKHDWRRARHKLT